MRIGRFLMWVALALLPMLAKDATAAERTLTLTFGDSVRRFTADDLLARPDAVAIAIPNDLSYRREMSYRAVPLLELIGADTLRGVATLEARASDGFVAQIPAEYVRQAAGGGAMAWIAIEDPADPWPTLPAKSISAGPFYLVWENPERSNIASEYWPYALVAIAGVADPVERWPQLAVDAALPDDAAERRGQGSFIRNCLPCHRLNGAGEGDVGPDLGQPMNVTEYMTPAGLKAVVRDPKSVRTWPGQQMPGFGNDQIPDAELDALVSFFAHVAGR
ncbi:c-type cytochrome [Hyphomicrobium sp.]|uniref:c-type cytochrome n=1 Tax=Hyphomicrobium sp. TaxID=82 RepID=UPI002B6488F3|nr:c-type cytochrome [Hyphomicrobium sp.]HRN89939.1 c-type cytochrome [Hyphomicrobium sp.]HRQ27440.1 c-type cytochrome [Hyphomicrobium sp.]